MLRNSPAPRMSTVVSEAAMGVQVLNSPSWLCRAVCPWVRHWPFLSLRVILYRRLHRASLKDPAGWMFVIPVCAQKSGLIAAGPGAEA